MVTRGNPVEINKLEKRYTWHDPDSNPDRSRGKPALYQLRHEKETKRFFMKIGQIGQMSRVESRDRHCDGDLKTGHYIIVLLKKIFLQ